MEIKIEDEVIDATRLYTFTRYAEKLGVVKTTVLYRVLTGKLKVVEISGIKMIVHEEDYEKNN